VEEIKGQGKARLRMELVCAFLLPVLVECWEEI